MSRPKPVLNGKSYMITRRCSQRTLLLRPSEAVNSLLLYLLAMACQRSGVLVHAVCIMSNHMHLVVTDARGELPEFCRWFHEFVAKCINRLLGRVENVFAPGSYSRVELINEASVLDKIVYTLCNPVAAGLVAHGKRWPGLRLGPWHMNKSRSAKRPLGFFRKAGPMAPEAVLAISKPPIFAHLSDEAYIALVDKKVAEKEVELEKDRRKRKCHVLGDKAVRRQDPMSQPQSVEEPGRLKPRFASRDKWARIEAIQTDQVWQATYDEVFDRYRDGDTDVEFPAGTYWMVRFVGAKVVSIS